MSYMYQIALGATDPIWLVHTVHGSNYHKIVICHRDAFDCGDEGTPNLAIYTIFHSTAGVKELCVPISLGPTDPIWLVHTVQGGSCHEIIICRKDALVCGSDSIPK